MNRCVRVHHHVVKTLECPSTSRISPKKLYLNGQKKTQQQKQMRKMDLMKDVWRKKGGIDLFYCVEIKQSDAKPINMSITITYRNRVLGNCKSSRTRPNRLAIREWQLSWLMYDQWVIHLVLAVYLPVAASVQCSVSCCSCWCDDFRPALSFYNTTIDRIDWHSNPYRQHRDRDRERENEMINQRTMGEQNQTWII